MQDSYGTKNQPQYADTGGCADAADLSQIANYAAKVGNRKSDLSTVRAGLTGSDVWEGLEFYETDTKLTYVYQGGGWVQQHVLTFDVLTATTDASGLINNIAHNLGRTPRGVKLQQYFSTDTNNATGLTHLTVGAVTSTTFQVVAYRNDTNQRLLNTAVQFYWEARG